MMAEHSVTEQPKEIQIELAKLTLYGNLIIPKGATAMVIFAHGSGSSRFSPRNQYVANYLNKIGLATLLFDLLTKEEEIIDNQTLEFRFNIPMLANRLVEVTDWVKGQPKLQSLYLGYFGSSTGAAAALIAAANRPAVMRAVVSRGGRPDLADRALSSVQAATLLVVGELDDVVINLNKKAMLMMTNDVELKIVSGASHLFEEPGKLDEVMKLAGRWFIKHLTTK